ncbi:molybdenum hydroxylase family protein [Octadecabacter antarcticus 307]|uniref:Molybdenum hydroxylase family protein n=1 Tax=Octadecabacter antarcticus 307 TaxID=391626 RepID=M9R822_9RHOB|nr:FAD binding domain-containing protein [Octadecabacter antarcticus]AGI67923.1 molybdenum hydroxylase family protein [Octadecabacter antarcticus 307]
MSYHRPIELASALQLLAEAGGIIVAGGTDVYPSAQQGIQPNYYLDVTAIVGFADISHDADGTRLGASVTWSQLIQADLPAAFDCLKEAAREVGSVQIQNAGTIAGNLCNASPAADGVPPLLALEAQVELCSAARGTRTIALSNFIQGVRQTNRANDELLTAIIIPDAPNNTCSAFEKLGSRKYLVISITMSSAVVACNADGKITYARVAVGACSPVAQRLYGLEEDMIGKTVEQVVVARQHLAALSPIDDIRGSGSYRLDVVAEQCTRAIQRALRDE